MTLNDMQRAALALFAAREAGPGASLEQMKAIAFCVRNRVKQGWHDGQWLSVMEHADEAAGNLPGAPVKLDLANRALQRLIADVDDIYYGGGAGSGKTTDYTGRNEQARIPTAQRFAPMGGSLEETLNKSCYWAWVNQPFTPWFQEHVLDSPKEHPLRTQMGLMAFYE